MSIKTEQKMSRGANRGERALSVFKSRILCVGFVHYICAEAAR